MEKKITFTEDVLNISNEKLEKIFENSGNTIQADWSYVTTNKRSENQSKNGTLGEINLNKNCIEQITKDICSSKMKCQDCGRECFDDKYPEVVFKDKCHCICENCSINYYEDSNGKIKLRERF